MDAIDMRMRYVSIQVTNYETYDKDMLMTSYLRMSSNTQQVRTNQNERIMLHIILTLIHLV